MAWARPVQDLALGAKSWQRSVGLWGVYSINPFPFTVVVAQSQNRGYWSALHDLSWPGRWLSHAKMHSGVYPQCNPGATFGKVGSTETAPCHVSGLKGVGTLESELGSPCQDNRRGRVAPGSLVSAGLAHRGSNSRGQAGMARCTETGNTEPGGVHPGLESWLPWVGWEDSVPWSHKTTFTVTVRTTWQCHVEALCYSEAVIFKHFSNKDWLWTKSSTWAPI